MKKLVTFAVASGAALLLMACGNKTEEAPAEAPAEEMAPTEEMAPAEDAAPAEGAEAAPAEMSPDDKAAAEGAEGVDPNNNPVGM